MKKSMILVILLCSCSPLPSPETGEIEIYIEDGIPVSEDDVLFALDFFADNVHWLIHEAGREDVQEAYAYGLEIHIRKDTLPCDVSICPSGSAPGLYYSSGRIELTWHPTIDYMYATSIMHELVHFVEDRITGGCPEAVCDKEDDSLQLYCEQHRCPYWDDFGSVLQYRFYRALTG